MKAIVRLTTGVVGWVEGHLVTIVALLAFLFIVTHCAEINQFSRDVSVVTSCRATACGFDR